jgi:hypothetical protein
MSQGNSRRELLNIISHIQKIPDKGDLEMPIILNTDGGKAEQDVYRTSNIHL